jgi:hypothetical protein
MTIPSDEVPACREILQAAHERVGRLAGQQELLSTATRLPSGEARPGVG